MSHITQCHNSCFHSSDDSMTNLEEPGRDSSFHCSPVIDPDSDERVNRVLLSSLYFNVEKFYHGQSVCCMPIASPDTSVSVVHQHLVGSPTWWADEATQGIDPDGSEKSLEETHLIPLWQVVNPDNNASKWCRFWQTSGRNNPTMDICLWHALWSDFWSVISDTRVKESGVHGWRQCESLLSSLRSIAACKHLSCMQLVRASYVPKRKLPYPSACLPLLTDLSLQ